MTEAPVVRTEGLTKAYGRRVALSDLDLEIEPGEVFGYLGPNGAGKTTTLRLLAGMLRPTSGRAQVLGRDAWRDSVAVHRQMGYLSGEPAMYDRLTGRDHAEYLGFLRGKVTPKRVEELSARLDLDLDRPSRELSKGNKQKLALVLAMMSAPTLLVLDEPTGGLDPIAQQDFHEILREHTNDGGSVLLSSHVLSEVQRVADRVGVLRSGRLVAVERLDELRSKSLHHVQAHFSEPIALEEFADLPNLVDLSVSDHTMTCSAPQSALDLLLKRVSQHQVIDFECFEAELEETFLTYYGEGGDSDHAA
jgi:ABC-2 type transport system ATP-binding protein